MIQERYDKTDKKRIKLERKKKDRDKEKDKMKARRNAEGLRHVPGIQAKTREFRERQA